MYPHCILLVNNDYNFLLCMWIAMFVKLLISTTSRAFATRVTVAGNYPASSTKVFLCLLRFGKQTNARVANARKPKRVVAVMVGSKDPLARIIRVEIA